MENKLIIFDFDGVIINTTEICFNINSKTNPHMTCESYVGMSHSNFYDSVEKVKFVPNPTYHEEYHEGILNLEIPPIIKELIINLSRKNRLAIVSSGSEVAISSFLKK